MVPPSFLRTCFDSDLHYFFFGEDTLDLVYIIISFLCICMGSYLVPYLFPSLFVFDISIWISFLRTSFFFPNIQDTPHTVEELCSVMDCHVDNCLSGMLCLVNAIKCDFRKNYRWISCYYHTFSIG